MAKATTLTLALDEGGCSASRPGRFTPAESRLALYMWLDVTQGRSGRARRNTLPPGFDTRTIHPVASPLTDCTVPDGRGMNIDHVCVDTERRKPKRSSRQLYGVHHKSHKDCSGSEHKSARWEAGDYPPEL